MKEQSGNIGCNARDYSFHYTAFYRPDYGVIYDKVLVLTTMCIL